MFFDMILQWDSSDTDFRFRYDPDNNTCSSTEKGRLSKFMTKKNYNQKTAIGHKKELSRVFSEDYEVVEKTIFDPRGPDISRWNKLFLVACLISLFVDPLFLYLPQAKKGLCVTVSLPLEIDLTIIRSVVDVFYVLQIFIQFRTAYVAPSSRVFGRGELVIDPSKIASRYLHKDFWLDIIAAQPLPQVPDSFFFKAISNFFIEFNTCFMHIAGIGLVCNSKIKWFIDGAYEKHPTINHHIPISPKAIPYLSTFISNHQDYWCCDRNSMGRCSL